jgi:hypothetical protein
MLIYGKARKESRPQKEEKREQGETTCFAKDTACHPGDREPVDPASRLPAAMRSYRPAGAVAGAQKRSKALVRSLVMEKGSRPSMSRLSSMKTTLPSRIRAIEGEDGA